MLAGTITSSGMTGSWVEEPVTTNSMLPLSSMSNDGSLKHTIAACDPSSPSRGHRRLAATTAIANFPESEPVSYVSGCSDRCEETPNLGSKMFGLMRQL